MSDRFFVMAKYKDENRIVMHSVKGSYSKAMQEVERLIGLGHIASAMQLDIYLRDNDGKEYKGAIQIIEDLRNQGYSLTDSVFIDYIVKLEKRYRKEKNGNKYNFIMDKCKYFLDKKWLESEVF